MQRVVTAWVDEVGRKCESRMNLIMSFARRREECERDGRAEQSSGGQVSSVAVARSCVSRRKERERY